MALVRNTLLLPGGDPTPQRVNTQVRIQLINGGFAVTGAPSEPEILGQFNTPVDSQGVWEIDLVPNEQIEPSGTFYRVEETAGRVVASHIFVVPRFVDVLSASRTTNVVTATLDTPAHGIRTGDSITVDLADNTYDGTFTVTSVNGATITWNQVAANDVSGGTGTVNKTVWDLFDLIIPAELVGGGQVGNLVVTDGLSVGGDLSVGDELVLETLLTLRGGGADGTAAGTFNAIDTAGKTLTLTSTGSFGVLSCTHTVVIDGSTSPFTAGLLFNNQIIFKNTPTVPGSWAQFFTLNAAMTFRADGAAITGTGHVTLRDLPVYDIINAGTLLVNGSTIGLNSGPTIGAGVTHSGTRIGVSVADAAGAGTLSGEQVGVDIALLAKSTLRNIGIRNASTLVHTPSVATMSGVGSQVTPNAAIKRLDNTSGSNPLVLTSNPHILDGQDGQELLIFNGSANAVRFTDGNGVRLTVSPFDVGQRDSLRLVYSTTIGDWIEVGRSNVI